MTQSIMETQARQRYKDLESVRRMLTNPDNLDLVCEDRRAINSNIDALIQAIKSNGCLPPSQAQESLEEDIT